MNQPCQRIDALPKVTGRALYGADLSMPGMLTAKVLMSEHPHARIFGIDTHVASALPGVVAVLTAADIPGSVRVGVVIEDQPVLCDERARYLGDAVALVAAVDEATVLAALDLIKVDYEPLEAVFSPEEAVAPEAPVLHQERPDNVVCHHRLRKGDTSRGFSQADVVLEREYRTSFIEHAYLEPEALLCFPDQDGRGVEVRGSFQNPFATRSLMARALALPLAAVRVVQATLGGSFGGKDEVMHLMAIRAALLAIRTGRPIKMILTREESLRQSYKRHPYHLSYKVGARKDGKLTAMQVEILADAGAYASQSPFVTWRSTVQCCGPYEIPHVQADIRAIYTNNTYTGAMRGFGSPQVIFAVESLLDELAGELGLTPLQIRRRNLFRSRSETATGQVLEGHRVSAREVLDRALEAGEYERKAAEYSRPGQNVQKRRGIGLACSFRGCSLGAEGLDFVPAQISLQDDGSALLAIGLSENGAGQRTVFAQIAAQELGLPLEKIHLLETDTASVADGGSTVASRGTLMGGNAIRRAAWTLRKEILEISAQILECPPEELEMRPNGVSRRDGEQPATTWPVLVNAARRMGKPLMATGIYQAPAVSWDEEKGQGKAYFTYVYGCQVAEVEVDMVTGQVQVLHVAAAHDLGKAINPALALGQVYGGVAMGLGYALLEEVEMHQGLTRTLNFDTYEIVTSMDMPEVSALLVENPDPEGPFGAKSVGEPTNELLGAAVANAIAMATGRRIRELPCDLERVLLGYSLREKREDRASRLVNQVPERQPK